MNLQHHQEQAALQFARLHDWGHHAFLAVAIDGTRQIIVEDWWSRNGKAHCNVVAVTPTVRALRWFGGY